ncbi:hypothetical protein MMYC01_203966 [Madurella mycetomatis]|uniref:Uncharacterized protein n=1 Tax=Madurella mycetomatis TaxID=100816 RepID=A0A175W6J0_9PEZI|nr:hypothetical protein MMYC01_203966 [Madurella mycetomatis]
MVVLDKSSNTVIEEPFDNSNREGLLRMQREREVYEWFAQRCGHKGLLFYHRVFEPSIRLGK